MNAPTVPGLTIRDAAAADMAAIAGIYRGHVLHGLASFEVEPPSPGEMDARRRAVREAGLPYYVAELDGAVAGYAYAALYRTRVGYRYTVEDSIYVSPGYGRRGIGLALLDAVVARCTALGYRQMLAVIGDSANLASIRLHEKAGFRRAGTLPSVGFKLGRWVDAVLMQRPLGPGDTRLPGES
ncbi:MAG: GNAT family N-acetyltransferase [Rhodospirillaceae bacterium]|nr:GNAT family N-acetyltransferase [Rhodospirillaceae bacterium]